MVSKLSWTYYRELLSIKDVNKIIYYINQSIIKNLTTRESREIIKNNSYSRMNKKLKYIALNKKYKKIKKTVIW